MSRIRVSVGITIMSLAIALTACGGSPAPGGPGGSVIVTPSDVILDVADTQLFTAVVDGGEGPQAVSWSSDDTTVITVDAAGTATALAPGVATVTATSTADANLSGQAEVTVRVPSCRTPTDISSDIRTDRTLARLDHAISCTDYVVDGWLNVYADLVIEPGVTVGFTFGSGLFVTGSPGGSLTAVGQLTQPISFRLAAGAVGPWRSLVFGSSSPDNRLDHVFIEGTGAPVSDAIYPHNIRASVIVPISYSVSITNTQFLTAEAYGVWVGPEARLAAFSDNSFQGLEFAPVTLGLEQVGQLGSGNSFSSADQPNGLELIELQPRPDLTVDVTVTDLGVPYRLLQPQAVKGVNLTLEAGVTLQFAADAGLTIEDTLTETGSLTAIGEAGNEVVLTAAADPATAASWRGLLIASDGPSEIRHALIGYGGSYRDWRIPPHVGGNIVLTDGARLSLSHTTLHDAPLCYELLGSSANFDYSDLTMSDCT